MERGRRIVVKETGRPKRAQARGVGEQFAAIAWRYVLTVHLMGDAPPSSPSHLCWSHHVVPYVTPEARDRLDDGAHPKEAGELNYAVTRLIDGYLASLADRDGRTRYAHLNEAIGVLECAKLELYRRIASPYEDEKIAENGDVYTIR